jgi:diguanylate cyclase (GGDEF)-like protein
MGGNPHGIDKRYNCRVEFIKRIKTSELLRQLFLQEERRSERYANYARILFSFLYLAAGFVIKHEIPAHSFDVIVGAALINLIYGLVVYFELRKETPASWIKYPSVTIDIILLSLVLYAFGTYRTFKSEAFLLYYLWIGLATLRFSPGLTLLAGLLSLSLYFGIACLAIINGTVQLGTITDEFTSHMVSQTNIVLRLTFLAVFVGLASYVTYIFRNIASKAIREDLLEEKNTLLAQTLRKLRSTQKQLAARNRELATLSEIDALTQLFNRHKIHQILKEAIRETTNPSGILSVILLDIDRFKAINDEHGHQVGDKIIRGVADQLRLTARGSDCIGRWGGEEYLIVCPDTDHNAAQILSERLRTKIESHSFNIDQPVTCSFGVVVYHKGETLENLLKRLSVVHQESKKLGRNRVTIAQD